MPARPNDPWADYVAAKLRDLTAESIEMRQRMVENTALTQDTKNSIYELMALLEMGRGFFNMCQKIGNGIRRFAKWIAPIISVAAGIITAVAGIYAFIHNGWHGK